MKYMATVDFFFPPTTENPIFALCAVAKQVVGWIWPVGLCLPSLLYNISPRQVLYHPCFTVSKFSVNCITRVMTTSHTQARLRQCKFSLLHSAAFPHISPSQRAANTWPAEMGVYVRFISWAYWGEWEQLCVVACKSLFKHLLCHLATGQILNFFDFVLYLKKLGLINDYFTRLLRGLIQILYSVEPSRLPGIAVSQPSAVFYFCILAPKPVRLARQYFMKATMLSDLINNSGFV